MNRRLVRILLAAAALAPAGCATPRPARTDDDARLISVEEELGRRPPPPPRRTAPVNGRAAPPRARASGPPPERVPDAMIDRGPPGTIGRAVLERWLSASPALFLRHIDVRPAFRDSRFLGWRVRSFFPGESRIAGIDLRAGDVVTRVNGGEIERPEQFIRVWHAARGREALVVDGQRGGKPFRLTWKIID